MNIKKALRLNGTLLDKRQLESHLEKIATDHNLKPKSQKDTYPVPDMIENYKFIKEVYNLLNEHVKLGITIHPAGEWILDNFYIIEETVKQIQEDLTVSKYVNFLGIANGPYQGFARIYVLAFEIIAYTEGKIEKEDLERYIESYQKKRTLNMDEIWNIGVFLQIAIISSIKDVCEKIYSAQIQKYKVENIVERLIENKDKADIKFKNTSNLTKTVFQDMKYPFIEYMSYTLKRYGKKGVSYLKALEETVEISGSSVSDVIKKEHFDIAIKKVLISNYITSIKEIQRIDFLEIFQKLNGVEEILNEDPANVYIKMEHNTKAYYRNKIKEISTKTKISEIYIAKKTLELAKAHDVGTKQSHIGYYLIDNGINELYEALNYKASKKMSENAKTKVYVLAVLLFTIGISIGVSSILNVKSIWLKILSFVLILIPVSEIVIQVVQYILNKIVKPKLIPKIDLSNGIDEENRTIVVIPTILKSKEKVKELMRKLEVYYIANKSENLYFALLGDCSQSKNKDEKFDNQVVEEGLKQVQFLNEKYNKKDNPIFFFIYRNRIWNSKENSYLGWERKRGLLNEFNEYILGQKNNTFKVNTFEENCKIENLKYVITLDADTDLILESAFQLVGAMAHILNKPIIDEKKNIVVDGYGIIQPRVGINLDISYKNLFTKIFAGSGGIDSYTNAISDTYQDNFGEGIFTGKGIYDIQTFSKVMKNTIPENTVLSHDLLEGNYLRCGLATDIMLMDGYPCKYLSFMARLSRWIRGDWQIAGWLKNKVKTKDGKIKNPLNLLSKYKIFDNLRRSLLEISIIISFIYLIILKNALNVKTVEVIALIYVSFLMPFLFEIINEIIFKKEGEKKQKDFLPRISGIKGAFCRLILTLGCLPYKAFISTKSIVKTIYRVLISKKHLLEWTTSEEAEKQSKTDVISYYKQMIINVLFAIFIYLLYKNIFTLVLGILWIITPYIMCTISKEKEKKTQIERLNKQEKDYVIDIAKRTWQFFDEFLNEKNNFLIPDNYQEDRKEKIVSRTSSTNIGLSLLAVISAYDLKFIDIKRCIDLLNNILTNVQTLEKWNGHLYNWYNTKTKKPLIPRYISTVDSGNFVGYLFVVKTFLGNIKIENEALEQKIDNLLLIINNMIENTDFSPLYDHEHQIFSIGFNIEDNRLTDSYYDLLASEARQASLIAIAKKDVPVKHWKNLSRTITTLNGYSGLVSWSGTAFEYLMPNINIPKYEGSLLDESCKFMEMCQIEYAKKLNLPWGISEAAFNLKDLHSNYQYKAFGVPWLGLKRGLADEFVVSSYGSVLAINEKSKEVVKNLKLMEQYGAKDKYGFYESIDFTPQRVEKNERASIVKTYMAHHQGLILLSINNLFNNNILQKRFMKNPEIEAVSVLLQERKPEKYIVTKEDKEKVEKLKYLDYEDYIINTYQKVDERLIRSNIISNENYTIGINQKGAGVSKYKDLYINRFKVTDDYMQGIYFYVKNIKTKDIWTTNYPQNDLKKVNYETSFMPDKDETKIRYGNIKSKVTITVDSNEPVEIRRLSLENIGNDEEILEISSYFEPVLSTKAQEYAHPAFNNLFLKFDYDEEKNILIVKRKERKEDDQEPYLASSLFESGQEEHELEYEIDKEKLLGRGNLDIPNMIKNSIPFSKKLGLVTEPVIAFKRIIKIKPNETKNIDLILSANFDKEKAIYNLEKYKIEENVKKAFELSKARVEAESRYLRIKGKDIDNYQKMLSYIIFQNPAKSLYLKKYKNKTFNQSELWKYGISGDLPIILVKINDANESYVVKEVLKAYEYFKTKNVLVDIVILDEEKYSYENYVKEEIEGAILNSQMAYLKNIKGGIFTLSVAEMERNDIELINFVSSIIIDGKKGGITNNLKEIEEEYLENYKEIGQEEQMPVITEESNEDIDIMQNVEDIKYYNEYGGFSKDGKEYLIKANKQNRLPTVWSHILANEKFGTLVTQSMGGYTWYKNSRLNRITSWENSANYDIPPEAIYLKDIDTKKTWSLGLNPMPDDKNYNVIYGFGYAKYIHKSDGIEQELEVFVPKEDSIKVQILKLKNTTQAKKRLKLIYYTKPVLGEDGVKSNGYINLDYDKNNNIILAKNMYLSELLQSIAYVSCSEKIKSYTGNKNFFFGKGGIQNPDGIKKVSLNNENSLGQNTCICYEIEIEVESFSEKEISILLGAEDNIIDCKNMSYKYSKIPNCKQELNDVKSYWKELLGRIQVYTPLESVNIILNGWLAYQTIESRLLGRTGFYQSGGAYGFRDQLQDTFGLKYLDPDLLKNQIIKHSKHQFLEGDVEHWWHEETKKGIRTKFSDDLLWLVFATIEYILFTGDKNILDIKTKYITGQELADGQDEKYDVYLPSDVLESIYDHCKKAIEKSLNFGEHGLPKIGSGDWNDGFSTVGNKGKGESVWLRIFHVLYFR